MIFIRFIGTTLSGAEFDIAATKVLNKGPRPHSTATKQLCQVPLPLLPFLILKNKL
jgi:hypothetical protein